MMRECYSECRSSIDENLSRSWIVFRHEIVGKLTSAAEFSVAEDLALFIIWLTISYLKGKFY